MSLWDLFIIAVALSMDAFSVSICKGLSVRRLEKRQMAIAGVWFGGFQGLMPLIGYVLGVGFQGMITSIDHWIAFVLLGFIGFNMVREALGEDEEGACDCGSSCSINPFAAREMLTLAVATSIDALAVGVTFAFLKVNIVFAVLFIGVTTFVLSAIGVKVGNVFGARYKSKAELFGGVVLIGMGLKILLEHLGVIG